MPFNIQPIHLVAIAIAALLIFGPKRLPEIGRGLGKALTEFRQGTREMTESFREEFSKPDAPDNLTPTETQPQATPATGNFCHQCGAPNPSEARYCNKCGSQIQVS